MSRCVSRSIRSPWPSRKRPCRGRGAAHAGVGAWLSPARAERADRDQPTNVESDRLYYDEAKQTTEFTGRVVLTKGTLLIRSDHMVLRQLAENQQVATARGKPADIPTEARRSR